MPLAVALAVRQCGLSIPDALRAATLNPARLLSLADRGVIRENARADLLLLDTADERDLAYRLADASVIHRVFSA